MGLGFGGCDDGSVGLSYVLTVILDGCKRIG